MRIERFLATGASIKGAARRFAIDYLSSDPRPNPHGRAANLDLNRRRARTTLVFPPPPEPNRTLQRRHRQPRLSETGNASRRAGCDEACGAARSHSSSRPAPGFAAFSASVQRRRRGVPVRTSTRRKLCPSIGKLVGTRSPAPITQGSITPLSRGARWELGSAYGLPGLCSMHNVGRRGII